MCSIVSMYILCVYVVVAGVEDPKRIPQAQFFLHAPSLMEALVGSNPYSLARVLFGKPLVSWPGLVANKRIANEAALPAEKFRDVILTGLL
jgi:hypothetical protein